MALPWKIERLGLPADFNADVPGELGLRPVSTKRSSTALGKNYYVPSDVVVWTSFVNDMAKFDVHVDMIADVDISIDKLKRNPAEEKDMSRNVYLALGQLGVACFKTKLVKLHLLWEQDVVDDNGVKGRPDITAGVRMGDDQKFFPKIMLEAKGDDNWPGEGVADEPLAHIWAVQPSRGAKFSFDQKPIIQLTTQMRVTEVCCGFIFNGNVAHFCKLDPTGCLHAAGPFYMHTADFWKTLVIFIRFSFAKGPWVGTLKMRAAASGAQDDNKKRTAGGGEDIVVDVPGPGLAKEYCRENYQNMLNEGAEGRPQVYLRRVKNQDVAVKAVDHDMDRDGSLRSELVNEIIVYETLGKNGTHDFIPEFVGSGKLAGGDTSAIATKFAGDPIDMWKPKDKLEATEVQGKALDALKSLHAHGFLHGDVALRNFVIDGDSKKVRVIDLGRSHKVDEVSKPELEIEALKSEFHDSFPQFL
jgi:hypothetical protein